MSVRLPFANFEQAMQPRSRPDALPVTELAVILNRDRALIHRWRREGLTIGMADRLCIDNGMMPESVWGRDFLEDPEDDDDEADG